jgi:GTPase SAR1 family protein
LDKNISNNFYSDIKGVFALFDSTKIKNFEKTIDIIKNLKEKIGNVIPFLLIGNKNDLKYLKVVSLEDAKNKTKKLKCECKESNCIDENSANNIIKFFISNIYYNDLHIIIKLPLQ